VRSSRVERMFIEARPNVCGPGIRFVSLRIFAFNGIPTPPQMKWSKQTRLDLAQAGNMAKSNPRHAEIQTGSGCLAPVPGDRNVFVHLRSRLRMRNAPDTKRASGMKTALLMLIFVTAGDRCWPSHITLTKIRVRQPGVKLRTSAATRSVRMWVRWVWCRPRRWLGPPG
jgi:hypothetical protein